MTKRLKELAPVEWFYRDRVTGRHQCQIIPTPLFTEDIDEHRHK